MAFKFGIEQNGVFSPLPPPMQMFLLSEGTTIFTAVALAAELGVPDLLANGPRSSDEIAQATSAHSSSLYRLLRLLNTFGIFSEVEPGRFAQTPLSELLRTGTPGSLRSWVRNDRPAGLGADVCRGHAQREDRGALLKAKHGRRAV